MSANRETLSALMDAQTSEFETRRVLKEIQDDTELSETWRRYHLTRSLMREQRIESTIDISGSVMAQIEAEESISKAPASKSGSDSVFQGFWKAGASMAVAASVTFAVLLGVQNFSSSPALVTPSTQAGVIQRAELQNGLMPTSLAPTSQVSGDAQSIGLIRLSTALSEVIDAHRALVPSEVQSGFAATWLPDGYSALGAQISEAGVAQIYGDQDSRLSVSIQPLADGTSLPSPAVYSQGELLAYAEQRGEIYLYVVGELSLTEAQQVLNSLESTQ